MDAGCDNKRVSIYFQCRIEAGKRKPHVRTREKAAEYFGVSVSSMANYERGITVPPLDLVMAMADEYEAPELENLYCMEHCPMGKRHPVPTKAKPLEAVAVSIVSKLDEEELKYYKYKLLKIAEDGKVSPDEEDDFRAISEALEKISFAAAEMKLIKDRLETRKEGEANR